MSKPILGIIGGGQLGSLLASAAKKLEIKTVIFSDDQNSPAFNFDEVDILPEGAIHLASNKINKVQSIHFKQGVSDVWGLQYHPEITYHKMITLIKFRKEKLIQDRKCFKNEEEIQKHIQFIEEEIKKSKKDTRMLELKNWLDYLKVA